MPRKGDRRKIATNVYEDGSGRAITYRDPITHKQKEIRAPKGTPISTLRKAVIDKLTAYGGGVAFAARGTIAAAVDALEAIEHGIPSWCERRAHLRAWVKALGPDFRMSALNESIARMTMNTWQGNGIAPKTIRERRWVLRHLYHVLYGRKVSTPVDDLPPPAKVRQIPTWIDPADIITVYQNLLKMEAKGTLRDAKTRARFMVRAACGKRCTEIMRARPGDVSLERREWRVRDAKLGWSEGLYLNDDMLAAWRVFIAAEAWGDFNVSALAKTLRSAGWNPSVGPNQLRHNVGIALSDAGIDLSDISGMLGHSDLRTTRRTYVPIRQARMQRASEALNGRLHGWPAEPMAPDGTET